jgi:Carboxypeptidase regulatory-like domain
MLFGFTTVYPAKAQAVSGEVHGTVTDPSGALIPSATLVLKGPEGATKSATSGRDGAYRFTGVVPGTYQLTVFAQGFASLDIENVVVAAGKPVLQNLTLEMPVEQQQVEVNETTTGVNTVAEGNASSIVIKGNDLNALSDDPDQLQSELQELAGPSAGPNGAQIFIDGFSGGQLPPKSSIREIRVNQNPFSAQYDKLGYGRVEILTKPGTDKLHGNIMISGNDSSFNSMNPFVTSQPSYYSTFMNGGIGGSLNSKTSWYFSIFRRNNATNSIINAQLWDWNTNSSYNYATAVAAPTSRLDINPRMDFQLGSKNTLTVRYMMDRQIQTNSGVSNFSLESQGVNVTNYEHTIQLSDSQVVSPNVVNETRLQYARETTERAPINTTPTVTVQSAFTGGGNSSGASKDLQNRFELLNYTTVAKGQHAIQFGGRLRWSLISNKSTSGFNGTFTYMSLDAYSLHKPSQYTVTAGNATTNMTALDAGLFYQDDFKFNQNLTLSYGLRLEAQNYLSELADWAPRVSMAWAPWGAKGKTVVRAGYGWFYDRFAANNILNTLRLDGVSQTQYVVNTPSFYEGSSSIPAPSQLITMSSKIAPTIYQLSPDLKASLSMQAAMGIERQWGKIATTSLTYVNSRGVRQYRSENVNAYLPGTYSQATGTGVRAQGGNSNIYQYQSGGAYKQNQLMASYSIQSKRLSIFGFYVLTFANGNTSGASYFSSNPFNPSADYGRASFDVRQRLMFGGTLQAPFGISLNPMLEATSGSPFDIAVGQDLNGDSKFNDRPAWATGATDPKFRMDTSYGTFDLNPAATAARIPYNMGNGPSQFGINLRLNKSFGVGPKVVGRAQSNGFSGGGPRGGRGGPGGGGLGPGGLSGSGGPPGQSQVIPRKYALAFTAQARNVLNHVNLAPPVGTLLSPLFGTSTRLAGGPWSNSSANRSVELQLSFNF